jgi:hypothetical protein
MPRRINSVLAPHLSPQAEDNRPAILFNKKISTEHNTELYTLAYYALKDAGKLSALKEMNRLIRVNKRPVDTLKIISSFVKIFGMKVKSKE